MENPRMPGQKSKAEIRKKRPDYKKWAKKYFKPGSNMIPPDTIGGFGPGKPLICDICKKRVTKLTTFYHDNKIINKCEDCEIIPEGE